MSKKEGKGVDRSDNQMDGNVMQSENAFLNEFESSLKEMQLMREHKVHKPSWRELFSSKDEEKHK
jgi:hypothetical protein